MKLGFLTWDGPNQNYLSSLFVPIFERLKDHGIDTEILQFSWDDQAVRESRRSACEAACCGYTVVDTWHRPLVPGTVASIFAGVRHLQKFCRDKHIEVLMPRSIIPAAMVLGYQKLGGDQPFVFDADGFMADERVDFAGSNPNGLSYRVLREIEAMACRRSDAVISRTARARQILIARAGAGVAQSKFSVVPNPKEESIFSPMLPAEVGTRRAELGIAPDAITVVYAGSIGPQYFPERMVRFVELMHERQPVHFVALTRTPEELQPALAACGVPHTLLSVEASEVPSFLAIADVGVAFRAPTFSQAGVAPIKVGEYLLCGLPVVSTMGVGDLDAILNEEDVGYLIGALDDFNLREAGNWVMEMVMAERERYRERARTLGLKHFAMSRAIECYVGVVSSVFGQ